MSRIGKQPVIIPQGVTVTITDTDVVVKGPKGELKEQIVRDVAVKQEEDKVLVEKTGSSWQAAASHGLMRSLIANMVEGVAKGYEKKLELVGTGYRVVQQGKKLVLSVGYSHTVDVDAVEGIELTVEGNNKITVRGISKYLVGQVAANIRKVKKPEPYKGKGIRFVDEVVRRKVGKSAGK